MKIPLLATGNQIPGDDGIDFVRARQIKGLIKHREALIAGEACCTEVGLRDSLSAEIIASTIYFLIEYPPRKG